MHQPGQKPVSRFTCVRYRNSSGSHGILVTWYRMRNLRRTGNLERKHRSHVVATCSSDTSLRLYNTTLRSIIPLPDPTAPQNSASHQSAYPVFPAGSTVMALYPDTSCFYRAEVVASPSDMHPAGRVSVLVPVVFAVPSHWTEARCSGGTVETYV
jgi:hypothetical protein